MTDPHAMMGDTYTWTILSLLIFLAAALRFGLKPAQNWLDSEIGKIRSQLEQAKTLRAEAEATLVDYKAKQQAALAEAEAIVAHAREEAVRLRAAAEADLHQALARHEQQALDRIRQAEREAMVEIRNAVIAEAMTLARQSLATQLDAAAAQRLVDEAIAELPRLPPVTAKAA